MRRQGCQRRASEYDVEVMISEVREMRQRRDEVRPRHLSVRECLDVPRLHAGRIQKNTRDHRVSAMSFEGPAAPSLGLLPGRSGRDIQSGW